MKKIKQQIVMFSVTCALFLLMGTPVQGADHESFNSEKIIADIEKHLQLSKEQWEKLKPVLEEKSQDLTKSMGESVDRGYAELEKLSEQFESMSRQTEAKINDIVTSEEARKLKEYLSKIDKEAIDRTKEKMIADLNELLALSEEQANKIKPVLEEMFNEMSVMIQGIANESSRNWSEFRQDFEQLTKDLYDKVRETLDDEQMEKLEQFNNQQEENIEKALFRV